VEVDAERAVIDDEKKMIDEKELEKLKGWTDGQVVVPVGDMIHTMWILWKIVRAGQEHCRTHGHTTDNTLEDALIEAGLADPAQAAWRKGLKKTKK
jgi:hypothetical protein